MLKVVETKVEVELEVELDWKVKLDRRERGEVSECSTLGRG